VEEKSPIDAQILQLTNRWGHVHHRQLLALGLSRRTISARCAAGKLVREHRGVYSVGHSQRTAAAHADAAVMACGERSVLSHDSAAALYGLRKWPRIPEISSPLRRDHRGIHAHRTTTLQRRDVTVRGGIRVTTVARTTADIESRLTDTELVRLIHEARRNCDLPNRELTRLYNLCRRAAHVYDSEEAPSRSIFRHEFKAFLVAFDLPIPEFEARWHGYEVDAFYEDHKLIVELDGYRDHSQPDRFGADRERDALAIELTFDTLRITWKRLKRKPAPLARQYRAILTARDPHARS
jgi:putative AbiEi antitoxin of type IV toxin-antitoxin system